MDDIVIVSTTFYQSREELRFKLALKFIIRAKENGYPIVIVDGSSDAIKDEFRKAGAEVYSDTLLGMGASKRLCFKYGIQYLNRNKSTSKGIVVWIEPEKIDFIRLVSRMVEPIIGSGKELVIPTINNESRKKYYPEYQYFSEKKADEIYQHVTKRCDVTPFIGPIAMTYNHAMALSKWNPKDIHSNLPDSYIQLLYPMIIANSKVSTVLVDFIYPTEQKFEEEVKGNISMRQKRADQLKTMGEAFVLLGDIIKRKIK